MAKKKSASKILEKFTPVLIVITIGLAFAVGVLWQKVQNLEKGTPLTKTGSNAPITTGKTNNAPTERVVGKLDEQRAELIPAVTQGDHLLGPSNAEVFLVEYSDLECPYCASFHPTGQQAKAEYGDKLTWVYRHFPLDTIHPKARPAAIAAECVAQIGGETAFWDFVGAIFSDQTKLTNLESVAAAVGAGGESYSSCVAEKRFENKVNEDYQGGSKAGVTGTPGNFIVNKKGEVWLLPGAVPFETLKATIDEALK